MNPPSSSPRPISRRKKILFRLVIAGFLAFFGFSILELMLRAAKFRFKLYPDKIEFGFPDPTTVDSWMKKDPDLFWTMLDYEEKLEHAKKIHSPLVFMGCSCTQYSIYPEVFERRVRGLAKDAPLDFLNAGTIGWTTWQGLQQMKRDVAPLEPKVITLFYGWNDHWFGFGVPDSKMARLNDSIFTRYDKSRVFQLMTMIWVRLARKPMEEKPLRVSPGEFESNLREMIAIAKSKGIHPVLMTAPTTYEEGLEPAYLLDRHLNRIEDLVPLHNRYIEIVRKVAADKDVPLCDLAARFDELSKTEYIFRYFKSDGLHLSDAGGEKVAEFLYKTFDEAGLLPLISDSEKGKEGS